MPLEPIHGVVVSVGYSDYLDISLSHNRPHLDHCIVITSPTDLESQRVAGKHNCEVLITEDGESSHGLDVPGEEFGGVKQTRTFNKGLMIERGLQQLPQHGWRCHFDADIVFPGNIRRCLEVALHDKSAIYGADRFNVVGWDAWQKVLATGWPNRGFEHHHFLTYPFPWTSVGSRLIYGTHGWVPIGYFQAWHNSVEYSGIYRTRTYPIGSNNAAHDDVQFGLRFDRKKRILIPEFYVAHLGTADASYGANWNGRKTAKFAAPTASVTPQTHRGNSSCST